MFKILNYVGIGISSLMLFSVFTKMIFNWKAKV
jgi:hypothetical protein